MKLAEMADLGNVRLDYLIISLLTNSSGLAIVSNREEELVITYEDKVSFKESDTYFQEVENIIATKNGNKTVSDLVLISLKKKYKEKKEVNFSQLKKSPLPAKCGNYAISALVNKKSGMGAICPLKGKGEIFFSPHYCIV
jgi:hypothetical protein